MEPDLLGFGPERSPVPRGPTLTSELNRVLSQPPKGWICVLILLPSKGVLKVIVGITHDSDSWVIQRLSVSEESPSVTT